MFSSHFRRFVHPVTIRRALASHGLKNRRPYKGLMLTQRRRGGRLNWARLHLRWTRRQWGSVLFSDESKFNVSFADGRMRVWRSRGTRFDDRCVTEYDRWGGGSVHVWGGITAFEKTDLVVLIGNVTAQTYINDVLRPVVVPFMGRHLRRGLFQQDNARAHTARATMQFLNQNGINVLDWPSFSPDLSPIEHLWDELGRTVRKRNPPPQNVQQLRQALIAEWNNLPQQKVLTLIQSMRRRIQACINANGGHTKY